MKAKPTLGKIEGDLIPIILSSFQIPFPVHLINKYVGLAKLFGAPELFF